MKIVFPESENEKIQKGIEMGLANGLEFSVVKANSLDDGFLKVKNGKADAIIAGVEYSSREVILGAKKILGLSGKTFSGVSIFKQEMQLLLREKEQVDANERRMFFIADTAACRYPTKEQLFEIVCQTRETAKSFLDREPRIAMLSFSTNGSGGKKDEILQKTEDIIKEVKEIYPESLIDGEMQLDAAVRPWVGEKKMPDSEVAGRADVLICPDLNAGNILYKAVSVFGGAAIAGPILQGFNGVVSDLSRGSSEFDVLLTIEIMIEMFRRKKLVIKD